MLSYELKPYDMDDCREGKEILRVLKEDHLEDLAEEQMERERERAGEGK